MFELIPSGTKIPFMNFRIPMLIFSVGLTALALYFIITKGFHYGVDFAGGVEIVVSLPETGGNEAERLRESLKKLGIPDASVQSFGTALKEGGSEFVIHFSADFTQEDKVREKIEAAFQAPHKAEQIVKQFRFVGTEKAYLTLTKTLPLEEVKKAIRSV